MGAVDKDEVLPFENSGKLAERHSRAHVPELFGHSHSDWVFTRDFFGGQLRQQERGCYHSDQFISLVTFNWELVVTGFLDLLDGFFAGHVVGNENRGLQVEVLDGELLTPSVVWNELGNIRLHALLLCDQIMLVEPIIVDEFSDVVPDVVGTDYDTSLSSTDIVLLDILDGSCHSSTRRASAQEAFLTDHSPGHRKSILVPDLDPFVDESPVTYSWDEVITDTFDLVHTTVRLFFVEVSGLGQNGPVWVNGDDLDVRVHFFQLSRNAGHGSSCACSHEHVVEFAFALVPDLLACLLIVSHWVSRVFVLIKNVSIWQFLTQGLSDSNMAIFVVEGILIGSSDDFSSEGFQYVSLFLRHLFWHGDDHLEAFRGSSHRKSDTCVSRGRLNQNVSRLDRSSLHAIHDHSPSNSILH